MGIVEIETSKGVSPGHPLRSLDLYDASTISTIALSRHYVSYEVSATSRVSPFILLHLNQLSVNLNFTARRYASAVYAVVICPSAHPS